MRRPRLVALFAATVATLGAGGVIAVAHSASAATRLPAHVFAPYFEAYAGDNPATLYRSGYTADTARERSSWATAA